MSDPEWVRVVTDTPEAVKQVQEAVYAGVLVEILDSGLEWKPALSNVWVRGGQVYRWPKPNPVVWRCVGCRNIGGIPCYSEPADGVSGPTRCGQGLDRSQWIKGTFVPEEAVNDN